MTEKHEIEIGKYGKIEDEFATKKDKRKAYQIFALSTISAIILTAVMYIIG